MKPLYKTTIVVWTDYDPRDLEASRLVEQAEVGDAYCSLQVTREVENPDDDEDWDGTEFFNCSFCSQDCDDECDEAQAGGFED